MKFASLCIAAVLLGSNLWAEQPILVTSPNMMNSIELKVTQSGVEMAVRRYSATQVTARFGFQRYLDGSDAPDGRNAQIERVARTIRSGKIDTPVYKKSAVDLAANEATVWFKGGWGIVLLCRDDGVAYRLVTVKNGERLISVDSSQLIFPSPETRCWAGRNNGNYNGDKFQNSWETVFEETEIGKLDTLGKSIFYLPFVFNHGSVFTAFTESDLRDYPGCDLVHLKEGSNVLDLWHSQLPESTEIRPPHIRVTKRMGGFAKTSVNRSYPWRVFILGDNIADLAASDIVYALAEPAAEGADFSWVKPGIATWEWWNGCSLKNVPFQPGVNTDTYLHFIDFAAEYGIPYLLIDAGWSKGDIFDINPNVDLDKIIRHGREKRVGVILWAGCSQFKDRIDPVMSRIAQMGAKGLKIDFFDRDDQTIVNYIEELAATAAKYRLVLDFHGMFKPTGLERKYPNILNYEGIYGLEQMKWTQFRDMPRNDCQAVFTRMLAGPMDYTPGGMRNATLDGYKPSGRQPPTQGTRVHQMALQALYFAPLQMMADSPSDYRENSECAKFMADIPTVWDDTVALPSEMGKTAALARRKGKTWYAAAIGDWSERIYSLSTDFLDKGSWQADIFEDAAEAAEQPTRYTRRTAVIKAGDTICMRLAPGGGFVIRFSKSN